MALPLLNINMNIPEAQSSDFAKATWCGEKWGAKGQQLANIILWKWGFVDNVENPPEYEYKCAIWNPKRKFRGKGVPMSAQKVRQTYPDCETLEGIKNIVGIELTDAIGDLTTGIGIFGGASAKNKKIDKLKWKIVNKFFSQALAWSGGQYSNGEYIDTCFQEGRVEAWEEILAYGQERFENRPEGISNETMAQIIGVGVLSSILVISKLVK